MGKDEKLNTLAVSTRPCGYPDIIRDNLAPAQYFRMAEVFLADFDLTKAKICLKKLRDNAASREAQSYADLLEKTAMPKDQVSEDESRLLRETTKLLGQGNYERASDISRSLIAKHPRLEWAYVALASCCRSRRDQGSAEEWLQKALKVNPDIPKSFAEWGYKQ